jgi:circadian clock protein KaiB
MAHSAMFNLRLYVAGNTVNSTQALANLRELCRVYLPGRHTIELVDVFKEPLRALKDQILMTPTLVKLEPLPSEKIVGTLSQTRLVLHALGLRRVVA